MVHGDDSMVMTTFTMHMTVRQLFFGGGANVGDIDLEMQRLAGQRMVAVNMHLFVIDMRHGDIDNALWAMPLELHAGLDILHALECVARHFLDQFGMMFAIAFRGGHVHLKLIAGLTTDHGLLQTRHNLAAAVQIGQRFATVGTIDHLTLAVGQCVMKRGNGLVGDLHNILTVTVGVRAGQRKCKGSIGYGETFESAARGIVSARDFGDTSNMMAIFWRCLRRSGGISALLAIVVLPCSAALAAATSTSQLGGAIDAQIGQPRFVSASWGIAVASLDTGRTLYSHEADRLLQPASTAKLYTAAYVLDTLGTDYRIPTQLMGNGDIRSGRIDGPLILYGMGDPTLDSTGTNNDWADQLAAQLQSRGVRMVHGDLIADDSYFPGPLFGSGWEARDLQSWFAVPSSALSVQENTVDLTVQAGSASGEPARLTFAPPEATSRISNSLLTGARDSRSDINLYRAPGDDMLYLFGSIAARSEPRDYKMAMVDPAQVAGVLLQQALIRHGIKLVGTLRVLHWPQHDDSIRLNTTVLAQIVSPPIMEVMSRGLKRSQNLYLQNLLLIAGVKTQASAAQTGDAGPGFLSTEAWAIRGMRDLLGRIGIAPDAAQVEEGAGLSRQDLSTPRAMVQLLAYMAKQPYATQLRDALPIAGMDGTLEFRMRDGAALNNVHAKTGSMNFVHCLVGYVTTASGEHLAFAIMLNNYVRDGELPSASRDVDAIAELLASFQGHS